jgi:hypothetical protein
MPNWKKLIVSGSDAILSTLQLSSTPIGSTETKILVQDNSGNIKFRTNLSLQGTQGTTGATGTQGTTGSTGATGIQGTTGTIGVQGTTGSTGTQGTTGTIGVQGTTGSTGTQGTTGSQGINGSSGISGGTFTNQPNYLVRTAGATTIQSLSFLYTDTANSRLGIRTTSPAATLEVNGDILINKANLSNQENLDVDIGIEVVAQVAISTYIAAFFDYVIKKGTNVRAGIVYACHDGTNVEFTETSTTDLGSTTDLVLGVDISAGNMRLLASAASDNWVVKSLVRAL